MHYAAETMRLFRFDRHAGSPLTRFGSTGVTLVRGVRTGEATQVGCFHYSDNSVLGEHPAAGCQLLFVVAGSGWVSGGDGVRHPIAEGQAAFFADGETHASGTEDSMAAFVVEAPGLDPDRFMAEVALANNAPVEPVDPAEFALVTYRDGVAPARRGFRRNDESGDAGETVLDTTPASEVAGQFFFCEFHGGRHAAESTEEILARVCAGENVRVVRGPYATSGEADQGMGELLS